MFNNKPDSLKYNMLEGKFSMDVVEHSTGKILEHYEDDNVIVLDAKEAIIYAISGSAVGHIDTLKIGDDIGSPVNVSGTPNFTFVDSNPDTIVRDAGSWVTDGFIDGMTLDITGSATNNGVGVYTIETVTTTTLTLVSGDVVVAEWPTNSPTIVGDPSKSNPVEPTENFNSSSMSVIHVAADPSNPLSVGYASATATTFSITVLGTDVLAAYPLETTKIITSAALHSANSKVFAYKRFPQKAVSALVDININWTIQY